MLDRASVRQAGQNIKRLTTGIAGLINNAGVMAVEDFVKSKEGVESQLESNHVGHFLLTSILIPELKKEKGVVINVSSGGYMYGAGWDLEDVDFQVRSVCTNWPPKFTHTWLTGRNNRGVRRTTAGRHTGAPSWPTSSLASN